MPHGKRNEHAHGFAPEKLVALFEVEFIDPTTVRDCTQHKGIE